MAVDVQLPSILVGDCILLPIKIDITISGEVSPSCLCILPSFALMEFVLIIYASDRSLYCVCIVGARYVDTFCWKLYNSILTPDQFAWRLCGDLNLPLTFQSRISLQISEQVAAA